MNTNDRERSFHCNSERNLVQTKAKLVSIIDGSNVASPLFQMVTQTVNSTAIRITIIPNGYIGTSRIFCHRTDNNASGALADLIIGGIT
jgi:hypothetical protein